MKSVRRCARCTVEKTAEEFNKESRSSDGLHSYCRSCYRTYQRIRTRKIIRTPEMIAEKAAYDAEYRTRKGIRERVKARQLFRYSQPVLRAENLCRMAKTRAIKKGIEYSLTLERVSVAITLGKCEKSGIPFDMVPNGNGTNKAFAPSIDRIDSSKGYTDLNVQVVCRMYNLGKCEAEEIDFIILCLAVAERNASNQFAKDKLKALRGSNATV